MSFYAFSMLLSVISILFIGSFVYSKNTSNVINRFFGIYCFILSLWIFGCFMETMVLDKSVALFWDKVVYTGSILTPTVYLHFMHKFTKKKGRKYDLIVVVSYLLAFTFLTFNYVSFLRPYFISDVIYKYSLRFVPVPGPLWYFFFFGFYGIHIMYVYSLLFIEMKSSSGLRRIQMIYLLVAYTVMITAGLFYFLLLFNIRTSPIDSYLLIGYGIIMAYTILRYRLLDIQLVFRKSMIYSLSAGILTSLFVVIIITMTKFFSDMAGVKSYTILAITSLLIAVLFNPLRNSIQRLVDKKFYKRSYDYYSTIQQVSSTLSSMFNQNTILKFIGNMIYEVMGLEGVYMLAAVPAEGAFEAVYLITKDGGKIAPVTEDGKRMDIDENSETIKLFARSRDIIVKDELPLLEEKFGRDFAEEIWKDIEKFKGEVLIPVFIDNKVSFLIILGGKLSGDMFTDEDINMLSTISDQMAIALKNAQLYSGRVQTERLASLGMMSATFAHEIRNPLTSLKTFAQLMPEKYNDPEFRDTFSKIVEGEIEKIDTLINDLLDFSSEKKSTRVNDFDLVGLVDETVDYIKGKFSFEKKNVEVKKRYEEKEIQMSGDAAKLKQAFGIIITNGYQAMNGSGTLSVDIKRNVESIDVAISDTGEGISHEDISRIFDPFVTTKEMGVGIGLAITKRIIEDHEGKIHVKSKLAEGTTFTISLPVNI